MLLYCNDGLAIFAKNVIVYN
uniref:Uncharacterized protein n=1 Tax=Anopheles dirus TaxID=7168 RepID=A0A182NWK4_9DIPT